MSRELILSMSVTVDGFVAGPNGEIDWMFPAMSDEGREWVAEQFWKSGLIAMGHRSYVAWTDFWPTAENVIAAPMNEIPKAVFSRNGEISAPEMDKAKAALAEGKIEEVALETWQNPIVAGKNLTADIQRLKAEEGKPILAIGGLSFASSLIKANLVDLYRLSVHPVALGRGLPLFGELEAPVRFKLEDLKQFATGAMVKTYRPI
jgi:dihydrofolate reductase